MKLRFLTILTLLMAFLNAGERPFFFKQDTSPSSRAEWFYTTWAVHLSSSTEDQDKNPHYSAFQLSWYRPTRSGLGYYAIGKYQIADEMDEAVGGLGTSYRFSSLLYGGIDIEAGWREENDKTTFSIHPGITFKPIGNLHFSVHDRYDIADDENLLRIETSVLFNPSITLGFGWDTDNTCDTEIKGYFVGTGIGVYIGMALDADGPVNDAVYRGGFSFQIEKWFSQYGETLDRYEKGIRDLRIVWMPGRYTPPVRFEAKHYAIEKTPHEYRTLAITESIEDFQPDETVITIKPGDNLIRISKTLPANANAEFRDNVRAIAEYNGIDDPSRIYVGQEIKIPTFKPSIDSLRVSDEDKALVSELLDKTYNTRIVETSISSALWSFRLEGVSGMRDRLPTHSILDHPQLLNTQALTLVYSGDYKQAEDLLEWALKASKDSPILKKNLDKIKQLAGYDESE